MEHQEQEMTKFEEKLTEWKRKGDSEKVNFIEKLDKKLLPSQVERIKANDRRVMRELFLPKWVDWELLQEWAASLGGQKNTARCTFCGQASELGINFQQKFVCENCFFKIKSL